MDGEPWIARAASLADFEAAVRLGREFADWDAEETRKLGLSVDELMGFQHDYRVDGLAARYAAGPDAMYLARVGGVVAGVGALVEFEPGIGEIKTVFVGAGHRGLGLGRMLLEALLDDARRRTFRLLRLETVDFMREAIALYERYGFVRCAPYYEIPPSFLPHTVFMERAL